MGGGGGGQGWESSHQDCVNTHKRERGERWPSYKGVGGMNEKRSVERTLWADFIPRILGKWLTE